MSTLNIVNKSPFEKRSLEQCLPRMGKGDSLLLIEDASVAAVNGNAHAVSIENAGKDAGVYVLQPDLEARGLGETALVSGIQKVGYDGFVELCTQHDRVHSWL